MNVKPKFEPAAAPTYAGDYYGWVQQQVALLKAGRFEALDIENLIDEVGDLGKAEIQRLESALRVALLHMLKWRFQPERRSRSWKLSIEEGRARSWRSIRNSPSLKPIQGDVLADAYDDARRAAARQTRLPLSTFPAKCPFTWEDVMDERFTEGMFED